MAKRLKLPNKVRDRLLAWAETPEPDAQTGRKQFARTLYRARPSALSDRLKLAVARADTNQARFHRLLDQTVSWRRPEFPVSGKDLLKKGLLPGPEVSHRLAQLEEKWVESDFKLKKADLLKPQI